jgi:Ca2+-transporting ATPase
VRPGRRIYDNLRKAMAYIIAVHVPIAGLALLPLLANLPVIFGPVHIAFLEMIIDPVCSMVFEAETEEPDVMRRPPRMVDTPLFSTSLILWSLVQGAIAFLALAVLYVLALGNGLPEGDARALTFVSLVLIDLGLILVNRSYSVKLREIIGHRNRTLLWIVIATLAMLATIFAMPIGRELFRFGPLHVNDILLILCVVVALVMVLESLKRFWRIKLVQ